MSAPQTQTQTKVSMLQKITHDIAHNNGWEPSHLLMLIRGILTFIACLVGLILFSLIWPEAWHAWAWTWEFWVSILALIFIIAFFLLGEDSLANGLLIMVIVLFVITVIRKYPDTVKSYTLIKDHVIRVDIPEWHSFIVDADRKNYCIRFANDTTWHLAGRSLPFVKGPDHYAYFDLKQADGESNPEVEIKVTFPKVPH